MDIKSNNTFKYDLEVGKLAEEELKDLLLNKTIEVKHDLQAKRTGNVFIEYESRGKKSGISTTTADYFCIRISDTGFHFIETIKLKELCRPYLKGKRDVKGGDDYTSKGILLPIEDLLK